MSVQFAHRAAKRSKARRVVSARASVMTPSSLSLQRANGAPHWIGIAIGSALFRARLGKRAAKLAWEGFCPRVGRAPRMPGVAVNLIELSEGVLYAARVADLDALDTGSPLISSSTVLIPLVCQPWTQEPL
jgi:hypothetical protein